MNLPNFGKVANLPQNETELLTELVSVWHSKLARNQKRNEYYGMKNKLKDLGIAIPPPLKNVETVVGWPAKAVDYLASRVSFDGFSFNSGDREDMEEIVESNRFKLVYKQATISALKNSCSFITVTRGTEDEPKVIISAYTAMTASALWDYRKKRVKCGLTVVDVETKEGSQDCDPIWVNLYTDTDVWEIKKSDNSWSAKRKPHKMGRPLMEPIVYRPSLDRPFGKSRISRAVMSITDSAVRCALRSEVAAEFYTAPQKYILGADDSVFGEKSKWEAYIGNWLALTNNEEGEKPTLGQLAQASMQPHTDYLRSLAARFSGETSIPISELGVVHDNPASAEAIYAAKESLVIDAEDFNETNAITLKTVALMAIASYKDVALSELDEDDRSVQPHFKNPARPSVVSQADAMVKVVSAAPWVSESELFLEELGFDDADRARLLRDKQKAEAKAMLQSQIDQETAHEPTMYEIASILKGYTSGKVSRQNTINLFERIGISAEEATRYIEDALDIQDTTSEASEKSVDDNGSTEAS